MFDRRWGLKLHIYDYVKSVCVASKPRKTVHLPGSAAGSHTPPERANMFYYFPIVNPYGFTPFNPLHVAVTKHIQCEIVSITFHDSCINPFTMPISKRNSNGLIEGCYGMRRKRQFETPVQ